MTHNPEQKVLKMKTLDLIESIVYLNKMFSAPR